MNNSTSLMQTESVNPATRETLGYSPLHSELMVKDIIAKARQAQRAWESTPVGMRAKKLIAVRDYLVQHADRLAEIISHDNGKSRLDALATEVLPAAMALTYYCRKTAKFLKDRKVGAGNILFLNKRSKIVRVPFGVIGIISPWNYPFAIAFSEIIMGLLAGNAVVWKAASETQMVGLALKESIEAAGLPDGVFNYVNLPGKIAGNALLEGGVDKLFFTGSVAVGKVLMAKAAETLTPLVLELGGNDAMLICEDADLYRAANGAVWAGFSNAGQSCGGVERIYVHEKVYNQFLEILKDRIDNLRVGPDTEFDVDMGAMTTERQISAVKQHIDDAVAKGAVIFAQSELPNDPALHNFIPAMVLINVNHQMDIMKHETFGPVVGVMKVKSMQEAVELANDSYLGLTGSVWSKNLKKVEKIGRQIKAGVVTINDHLMSHGLAETFWGGFKQSGIGRTHGEIGFAEFTQTQMVVKDLLPLIHKNMWWQPYSKKVYLGLKGVLDFLYHPRLGKRFNGALRMMGILPRMFEK